MRTDKQTIAKRISILLLTSVFLFIGVSTALAEGDSPVLIETKAYVERMVVNEQGQKVLKRVPAARVLPGDTIIFVNTVTNQADETINDIVVGNPIQENMTYVDGSASGKNAALTFSVDGGKSFDIPGKLLALDEDGKPRQATAADFTNIRWQLLSPLPSQGTQQVEFQAKVK
jgi:uncharacterized repeat protein (TIGR01451 family)